MTDTLCPQCNAEIGTPGRNGKTGTVFRSRYVRLDPSFATVIACPECKTELEVRRGKLIVFKRMPDVQPPPASESEAPRHGEAARARPNAA